jgi:hypothetical protein
LVVVLVRGTRLSCIAVRVSTVQSRQQELTFEASSTLAAAPAAVATPACDQTYTMLYSACMRVEYECGSPSNPTLTVKDEEHANYQRKVEAELAALMVFASMLAGDSVGGGSCVRCASVCVS